MSVADIHTVNQFSSIFVLCPSQSRLNITENIGAKMSYLLKTTSKQFEKRIIVFH